jgi:TolB-like protein
MKRLTPGLVLLALCSTLPAARADVQPRRRGKPVVAVMPFSSPTRYNLMGRNSEETFVTKLVQTRKLRVIQSSMVKRMLRKHHLRWTGTVDHRVLKAAQRWLKADFVMAGKLRYGGDAYILSVHVMDVNTLETTMAQDVDFRNTRKMRVAVRVAAKKIAAVVSGTGGGDSRASLFLNVNPRAFYDTSDACIRAMAYGVNRYSFRGSVDEVDEETKTVKVKGRGRRLPKGVPLDIYSDSGIGEPQKLATVYVIRPIAGGYETRYRMGPEDGIELGARVTSLRHRWVVAVGKVVDEAEDNDKLVRRFRSALLEKMSEGERFQQIEGGMTDLLASLSDRRRRFRTFKALFKRGVELVLEGKFYGSSGSRRAHFKIYSTLTGKILGELKFETSL